MEIPYFEVVNAETVVSYIHPGNKLATLVGLNQANVDQQIGRDVAMQVAAMSPVSIDRDSVPKEVVERELEIAKEQSRLEGKPEEMIDKIAQGRLSKFFKESTLLDQVYVKDGKISIREYLQQTDKALTVTDFKRFSLSN